ncbi:putative Disease resistance protein RPS2 [Corchorus capsularis]|uniref:Putative Disease resistance protein RPS2 n=1 Tax=Corchorus capsularis TaxID=210143 RepID=A0A1R3FUI4_COCAP|nr:putative Disease resistance protein RPS2 [Corchorus capsularis]
MLRRRVAQSIASKDVEFKIRSKAGRVKRVAKEMTDLKQLCKGRPLALSGFLKSIHCNKMQQFDHCSSRGFLYMDRLEEIRVKDCDQMELVFHNPTILVSSREAVDENSTLVLCLSKLGTPSQSDDGPEPNSEYLKVGNFEEIFQVAGGCLFSKLERRLIIKDLSNKLKVIWKDPTQILTFQNLTHFELANCEELRNVFSLVLPRNLPQLRHLKVEGCDNNNQIPSSSKAHSGDIYFPII